MFGSGGGLVQDVNRDTQRFAMKCCWTIRDGAYSPVYKNPVSDKSKASKSGEVMLFRNFAGEYTTRKMVAENSGWMKVLVPVFKDGEVLVNDDIDTIRSRAAL